LVTNAAECFGAESVGCTMSRQQYEFALDEVQTRGLSGRVLIKIEDYRDLRGSFDKIASIGMFEHVGRSRLKLYFERMYKLLSGSGLFLNRGVVRPERTTDGAETLFLQKRVFPGGELARLSEVVRIAGRAGFEVLSVKDLRLHYARTCRAWVEHLQRNAGECRNLVDDATYRTWLLYLAASAVNFEDGKTDATELVLAKSPRNNA
ncbi:MAG: class I SAM-dependent methyltransferase, partial [Bryobacteraceae bacterium]